MPCHAASRCVPILRRVTADQPQDLAASLAYSDRTLYRHQTAVLEHLGVTAWEAAARVLAQSTMTKIAEARTDPADLIDAARATSGSRLTPPEPLVLLGPVTDPSLVTTFLAVLVGALRPPARNRLMSSAPNCPVADDSVINA